MYALIVTDANISEPITGEFDTLEDAESTQEIIENSAGSWLQDYRVPELNLDGDVLFDEPSVHIMDAGSARAEGLMN